MIVNSADRQCRLCLQSSRLCSSHIIPDFLFAALYDEKHRPFAMSLDQPRQKIMQTGWKEKLLCNNCEQLLSKYERYASRFLAGRAGTRARLVEGMSRTYEISNIDAMKFHLFAISILWRANVASDKAFRQVSLGRYGEKIRRELLTEAAGTASRYPLIISALSHKGQAIDGGLILSPTVKNDDTSDIYRFVFGGIAWTFYIGASRPPHPLDIVALTDTGTMIVSIQEVEDMALIKNTIGKQFELYGS